MPLSYLDDMEDTSERYCAPFPLIPIIGLSRGLVSLKSERFVPLISAIVPLNARNFL